MKKLILKIDKVIFGSLLLKSYGVIIRKYKMPRQSRFPTKDLTNIAINQFGEDVIKELLEIIRNKKLNFSIDKNFYSDITLDKNGEIISGLFRVLTLHIDNIEFTNVKHRISLFTNSKRYISDVNMIVSQISIQKNNSLSIINEHKFFAIIWPPANHLVEAIKTDLKNIYKDDVHILNISTIRFKEGIQLETFIKQVYLTDDIKPKLIEKKIEYILHSIKGERNYSCVVVELTMKNPKYKVKVNTGLPQSIQALDIKEYIRKKYKNQIVDYNFDVILHITDNYYQHKMLNDLISLHSFFESIIQSNSVELRNKQDNHLEVINYYKEISRVTKKRFFIVSKALDDYIVSLNNPNISCVFSQNQLKICFLDMKILTIIAE